MNQRTEQTYKGQELKKYGTLHPNPEKVRDERFEQSEFLDPEDLLQVKYEMLRSVREEGRSVSRAAHDFGFSRPSFYRAEGEFEQQGVAGLLPKKRGPKSAHKLTDELLEQLQPLLGAEAALSMERLCGLIEERFELKVHPRSLERALKRYEKRGRKSP